MKSSCVLVDPDILGRTPVFVGTRVPIRIEGAQGAKRVRRSRVAVGEACFVGVCAVAQAETK